VAYKESVIVFILGWKAIQSLRPAGFATAFGRAEAIHDDGVAGNGVTGVVAVRFGRSEKYSLPSW